MLSGLLIQKDFQHRFGDTVDATGKQVLSADRQSLITSLLSAGTFVGSIGQAFTSDRFGRVSRTSLHSPGRADSRSETDAPCTLRSPRSLSPFSLQKGSIFIWSAIFTVGVIIQTATERSVAQITVGRFIAGLGVGAMSAIVPLYNGETAPKHLRVSPHIILLRLATDSTE